MESGFRTPLLDLFRRGDVQRDLRLLAAQGAVAPRGHEQLAILALLTTDGDPEVARTAAATIDAIPRASLAAWGARPDTSSEVRAFLAARGIEPDSSAAGVTEGPILDTAPEPPPPPANEEEKTTVQRIASMNIAQRVQLAMKGSREERAVLIRDSNKIVAIAVLSSPKITETEIESIAKMASLSDEVLRIIANSRTWMKRYGVLAALVKNPKTPVAISMNLLARLNDKDLRAISTDRNVPDVLRTTARQKIVAQR